MNLPAKIPLRFLAVRQIAAERQSCNMASDVEVLLEQMCATEFIHAEKKWRSLMPSECLWKPNSGLDTTK